MSTLIDRLISPGPKRILALDGGGVRGIVSLAFLERIETLLKERAGGADFRLSDYFDLARGTSTGSIIATGLALGWPVGDLIELYLNLSQRGFRRRGWFGGCSHPNSRARRWTTWSDRRSATKRWAPPPCAAASASSPSGWIPAASGCSTIIRGAAISARLTGSRTQRRTAPWSWRR